MTNSGLINALKNEFDITRQEAIMVVNIFFDEMSNAIASGERVEIRGLCSFYVKKYRQYTGRKRKTSIFQMWKGTEGTGGFLSVVNRIR